MDMIFDTATGQLSIDPSAVHPWGADLRAILDRHGQTINLRGVEMRLTVTADGIQVFDMPLPPPGVHYRRTDQDVIATGRVHWQPDQQIEVTSWCKAGNDQEVTAEAAFTAPRPAQTYPSWDWNGCTWVAPVPRPDDEGWEWNEAAGAWHAAD